MVDITKYLVHDTDNLSTALICLNKVATCGSTLFVVDKDKKLLGSITDGDIRRALIGGISTQESVVNVMNPNPYYLFDGKENALEYKKIRSKNISVVPVVNSNKEIVEIYHINDKKAMLPLDAILMAGGKGERLRPLTETCPKPLLKVGDKPIIDYNIENLIHSGIKNISVIVNYLKEQLHIHFEQPKWGIKINTVEEPKFLGTIGGVLYVDDFYHDTILLMNSDLYTNINFEDFYLHYIDNNADMSIAAVPYSITVPYGIFDVDGNEIKGIIEKPTYNYYANAGIYLIKRDLLKLIPKNTFFNVTDLITLLVNNNYKIVRFPLNGTWIDIGNMQDYQKANELVNNN